jgi:hypothetical protein
MAGAAPGDLQLSPRLLIPAAELRWRFSRSSGPGGQNVNTTDSRVELLFDLAVTPSLPVQLRARALRRLEPRLVDGCVVTAAAPHQTHARFGATALGGQETAQRREAAAARADSAVRGLSRSDLCLCLLPQAFEFADAAALEVAAEGSLHAGEAIEEAAVGAS